MEGSDRVGTEARLAARALVRARGFTAPALVALALGIGGGAALLSLVDRGLSHPAPVETLGGVTVPDSRGAAASTVRFSGLDRLLGAGRGLQDAAMPIPALQDASLDELLRTLAAIAGLALAAAIVNLSLLILLRAGGRRRELAIRSAVGGSRRTLLRQVGLEGGVLGGAGAVLGLIVAASAVWLLRLHWAPGLVPWLAGPVPLRAVLSVVGLLVLTAATVSLAPALAVEKRPLQPDLGAGDRSTADPREVRLRRRLGVAAVAGSVILMVGAGVLLRGFSPGTASSDRPFHTSDTLTLHLADYGSAGAPRPDAAADIEALLEVVSELPGVTAGTVSSPGTWFGLGTRDVAHALLGPSGGPGVVLPPGNMRPASFHSVSPGYFTAMEIPVIRGRDFGRGDRSGAPGALIVNEPFARQLLLGVDPIGKKVQLGGASLDGEFYTIVGVVADIRLPGLGVTPTAQPAVYLSALQVPPRNLALAVRTSGDPSALLPHLKSVLGELRPSVPLTDAMTMEDRIERHAAPILWFGRIFAAAAGFASILAVIGLHSVISYSVRRRRREIGVRMALGAPPGSVVRLILGESARLTAAGAAIGFAGALCLARLLEYLFHGVDGQDPLVYGFVTALLVMVAIGASLRPAVAAARLQPVATLREE